jgi:NitT/TauT family transport system substrate-binding protein
VIVPAPAAGDQAGPSDAGRRRLLAGLALLLSLPTVACSPTPPLRVAVQPWCGYQFLTLAEQEGWFGQGQVELLRVPLAADSVAALREGHVDAAALTLDEVLLLLAQGLPLSVALVFDVSAGADVLLAKPDIRSLPELAGQRIGVEDSALGKVVLASVLEAAGLRRSQISVVPIQEDHLAAWQSGALDALITYAPSLARLEALGLHRLFSSRDMPRLVMDVLAVRRDRMPGRSAALEVLTEGHFRALTQWRRNPIDTGYRLAAILGVGPEEVRDIYASIELPDALFNRSYLQPPADELRASAQAVAAILVNEGVMPAAEIPEDLFTARFLSTPPA